MNLVFKLLGLSWIWDKLDGIKTYLAAALAILTGLGGVCLALAGLGAEISPLLAAHNIAGLLELVKNIGADPNTAALGKAWLTLLGGLGLLGIGHKIDKAAAAGSPAALPETQTTTPEDPTHV